MMDQDDSLTKKPETFWGKGAGYLYLTGMGICLLSIPFPEEWKRQVWFIGLSALALGLVADGIDGAVLGQIDDFDGDISHSKSPISFAFAALLPFSLASILGFILLNTWMFSDGGESFPPIEDWVWPALLFFGFSLMFLSSAVTALAVGVIRVGRRFSRFKIARNKKPILFCAAVSFELLLFVGSIWLYYKVVP